MHLTPLDWSIFAAVYVLTVLGALAARRHMRGVADFLAAGRTAGRYLVSVGYGIALVGAITVVGYLEMGYEAGFATGWWGIGMATAVMLIRVTGWVNYRFRRTRCLTLAEFFERRYSRRFRIFAGFVAFAAGVVNFGIFPSVGARFFMVFLGLPDSFELVGIVVETYPTVMAILLLTAVSFVFSGGQVSVLVTDFIQGAIANIVYVVLCGYLLLWIGWPQVIEALAAKPAGESMLNPFDTSNVEDFNTTYFVIGIIGLFYNAMSWQGTQAYNSSARTAHEGKMGLVLDLWRNLPYILFLALIPVLIYTLMNHPESSGLQEQVTTGMAQFDNEATAKQMRGPLILVAALPQGLLGLFAAFMLGAFISTHNTYLHSWGSILVQDVLIPAYGKEVSPSAHLRLLRGAIVGVAIFIFIFSLLYKPTQAILLFFALTGAIFAGWSGAVIVGGLYTRWGHARGAWAATILGVILAVSGFVLEQANGSFRDNGVAFWGLLDFLGPGAAKAWAEWVLVVLPNGQELWGYSMPLCTAAYILFSVEARLRGEQPFDLDRLLHRGRYVVAGELDDQDADRRGWNLLGFTAEFTRGDKWLYVVTYAWHFAWLAAFLIGTVYFLTRDVPDGNWKPYDDAWSRFWYVFVWTHLVVSVGVVVWFTIGGIRDMRRLFAALQTRQRDDHDDGTVRIEESKD